MRIVLFVVCRALLFVACSLLVVCFLLLFFFVDGSSLRCLFCVVCGFLFVDLCPLFWLLLFVDCCLRLSLLVARCVPLVLRSLFHVFCLCCSWLVVDWLFRVSCICLLFISSRVLLLAF